MSSNEPSQGFRSGRPSVVGFLLCDSVALGIGSNKPVVVGLFDSLYAMAYPVVAPGAVVIILADVRELVECRVETVGYSDDSPLGARQLVGTVSMTPPAIGTVATGVISGMIVIAAAGPGTADLLLYGNNILLTSRPLQITSAPNIMPPPGENG